MNIENMKQAREWLAASQRFDMRTWLALGVTEDGDPRGVSSFADGAANLPCGTTACLAGEICINLDQLEEPTSPSWNPLFDRAQAFLALTDDQANQLFGNDDNFYNMDVEDPEDNGALKLITKAMVLAKLDELIQAGRWVN